MTKEKFNIDTEEMTRQGLHFGHRTSKINPKMQPFLFGVRDTIHIIDVEKTKEKLIEALEFVQKLTAEGKTLMLVGTKVQIKDVVREAAEAGGFYYVVERWLGGTFTNFGSIFKRIEYFKDLERKKTAGELEKYTKKERADIDEELREFERKFGGIKNLTRLPDAIFVCDMIKDKLAVKEARAKGIKVIGICDTNADPTLADFPVPASDDAISSVKYILDKVQEAIKGVKKPKAKS
ncbi:MAG: 30S ribosomal protein S2 [Candidatus Nealsonbacteria bacterium CG09_land_8_20_14_0_10_42_14]|uniref:Small ribosomal subunit protein uS2 n=1 Tax=Candidatus Nealsonbacteria bacterium CG09_land_8_20_14_0_10_42_14 TaxID=1974707 RepID=A0A2H0WXG5_9BACT|nr:MAG: 30S ribosomal protein S2 [Candidatus Nealsonbacteria bacterium CG09_land_8_20_14_0_10_42_14]